MPESYTGDEGDDALAQGYDIMDGNEDRRDGWRAINKSRDYTADLEGRFETENWPWARISGKPTTFAPSAHTHSIIQFGSRTLGWRSASTTWHTPDSMTIGGNLTVSGTFSNPSARRLKRNITPAPPLGDIFPELVEYEYINGDGKRHLGHIADDLVGTDAERFVIFDADGNPEAIDYLGLLRAQVAQLRAEVDELRRERSS